MQQAVETQMGADVAVATHYYQWHYMEKGGNFHASVALRQRKDLPVTTE
jgi:hypothetical protein